jgi:K+-transporting ATPase KdpF subunit
MSAMEWIGVVLSIALAIYLFVALREARARSAPAAPFRHRSRAWVQVPGRAATRPQSPLDPD